MIIKVSGGYQVVSREGKNLGGTYKILGAAKPPKSEERQESARESKSYEDEAAAKCGQAQECAAR